MLMMILILMSILMSMMFMLMKHPMSMGTTILIQTLLMTMLTGLYFENFWYSYIMFLIMVGGMLVLFIYMTSIASNEKFKFSPLMIMMMLSMTTIMMMMMLMNKSFIQMMMMNSQDMNLWEMSKLWELSMIKFFMESGNKMFFMIMILLLITLIAVVKITKISHGALRQKF